jgi:PKD repeat protein
MKIREETRGMRTNRLLLGVLAAGVLLAACADSTAPPPFAITATVDKASTTVGDSVNFVIKAQGNVLVRLGVDFGDGTGFERDLFGATTMTANQRHAFAAPGNYTVTAAVFAASGESRETTLGVQVR